MKGPKLIPQKKLFELYQNVARFPLSVSAKDLAYYVQLSRLDARLAEVITEHIRDFWWKYSSSDLNKDLKNQPWPSAILPMLSQISTLCKSSSNTKQAFKTWSNQVSQGVKKAIPQLYFVPTQKPRTKSLDREVLESRAEYKEAGYFSNTILFNKQLPGSIKIETTANLSSEMRLKINLYNQIKPRLSGTLRELEKRLGIDRTTLSEIKSGHLETIGLKRLTSVLDKLSLSSPTYNHTNPAS